MKPKVCLFCMTLLKVFCLSIRVSLRLYAIEDGRIIDQKGMMAYPHKPLLGSHFQCLRLRGLSWTESRVIISKRFSTKSSFPSTSRLTCLRYIFSFHFPVLLKCCLVSSVILIGFEPLIPLFYLSFQLANVLEIDLGLVKVRVLQGWKWKAIDMECLIWNDAFIADWEGGESSAGITATAKKKKKAIF